MNKKQKTVLLITAVVVGIMMLFPPYVVFNYRHMVIKAGYGFIFNLPPEVTNNFIVLPAMVDAKTLFIQIIAALVVGGLAFFAFRED